MQLTIRIHPNIALSKAEDVVAVGESITLTATTVPSDATVVWTSSDEDVAIVNNGVVTGISEGIAVIGAQIAVGTSIYTASCEVTVTED